MSKAAIRYVWGPLRASPSLYETDEKMHNACRWGFIVLRSDGITSHYTLLWNRERRSFHAIPSDQLFLKNVGFSVKPPAGSESMLPKPMREMPVFEGPIYKILKARLEPQDHARMMTCLILKGKGP